MDLAELGFERLAPNRTAAGQPPFPPRALLKLYLYGYLNRIRSSRALERARSVPSNAGPVGTIFSCAAW